jgi:hypothetical protein
MESSFICWDFSIILMSDGDKKLIIWLFYDGLLICESRVAVILSLINFSLEFGL